MSSLHLDSDYSGYEAGTLSMTMGGGYITLQIPNYQFLKLQRLNPASYSLSRAIKSPIESPLNATLARLPYWCQ